MDDTRFSESIDVQPWSTLDKPVHFYLEKLEKLIDPKHQEKAEQLQYQAWKCEPLDHLPLIFQLKDDVGHKTYGVSDWPFFKWNDMAENWEWMLLGELRAIYDSALIKDDRVFTIRPNLGIVPIPSLFGYKNSFNSESHFDSMPHIKAPKEELSLEQYCEQGVPDIEGGLTDTIVSIIQCWNELLSPYPNLSKFVHITLADNQGPFNIAFHLRGQNIYYDIMEKPELVHEFMVMITETYIAHSRYLKDFVNESVTDGYYWGYKMRGGVRIVDDNSILISGEQYKEFVNPYNIQAAKLFDGGMLHFCGLGKHIIDIIASNPYVYGLNFGNPEMQDLQKIIPLCRQNKICVLWDMKLDKEDYKQIETGFVIKESVRSIDEGKQNLEIYRNM